MDVTLTPTQLIHARSLDGARYVAGKFFAKQESLSITEYFRRQYPRSLSLSSIESHYAKASVPAAGPYSWAGELASSDPADLIAALIQFGEPTGILPRLPLQRVPFLVPVIADVLDDSGTAYWRRGPGSPKVVVAGSLSRTSLPPLMVAGVTVVTVELLRFARPGALEFLRGLLARLIVRFVDTAAFDPTSGPTSESQPQSLTYGISATAAVGQPRDDFASLLADYTSRDGRLEHATVVMSSSNATAWRLFDPVVFDDLTIRGGSVFGIPCVAGPGANNVVAIVDTGRTVLADDGAGRIDVFQQGSIEMTDTSTSPPSEAAHVSLFQADCAAVRFERTVNFANIGGGVAYLQRDYLVAGSPS